MENIKYVYKIYEGKVEGDSNIKTNALDLKDGFIHLSTPSQLEGTLSKHFEAKSEITLVKIPFERIAALSKWEEVKGRGLFAHLYDDTTDLKSHYIQDWKHIQKNESWENTLKDLSWIE